MWWRDSGLIIGVQDWHYAIQGKVFFFLPVRKVFQKLKKWVSLHFYRAYHMLKSMNRGKLDSSSWWLEKMPSSWSLALGNQQGGNVILIRWVEAAEVHLQLGDFVGGIISQILLAGSGLEGWGMERNPLWPMEHSPALILLRCLVPTCQSRPPIGLCH